MPHREFLTDTCPHCRAALEFLHLTAASERAGYLLKTYVCKGCGLLVEIEVLRLTRAAAPIVPGVTYRAS